MLIDALQLEQVVANAVKTQIHNALTLYAPVMAATGLLFINEWIGLENMSKTGAAVVKAAVAEAAKSRLAKMSDETLNEENICKQVKVKLIEQIKQQYPVLLKMDNTLTSSMKALITSKFVIYYLNTF